MSLSKYGQFDAYSVGMLVGNSRRDAPDAIVPNTGKMAVAGRTFIGNSQVFGVARYFGLQQESCANFLSANSRSISALGTFPFSPNSDPRNIAASVLVNNGFGCPWTAQSNATWLHIIAPTGSANGRDEALFTVDRNTGATRTGTLTIAGQTFTVTQSAANTPPNDNFANAEPLGGQYGATYGATVNATAETGEPVAVNNSSVWYRWTAPANGSFVFSLNRSDVGVCGLTTPIPFEIYSGTSLSSLSVAARNYPDPLAPTANISNAAGLDAVSATSYYIRVHGNARTFNLRWSPALKAAGSFRNAQGQVITTLPNRNVTVTNNQTNNQCGANGGTSSFTATYTDGIFFPVTTSIAIAPALPSVTWNPAQYTLFATNSNADFTATAPAYTVNGVINNLPVNTPNVTVTAGGASCTVNLPNYSCSGLSIYGSYDIRPQAAGYTFTPPNYSLFEIVNNQTLNFDAQPALSTLQFGSAAYQIAENGGAATITVTRTGNLGYSRDTCKNRT